MIPYKMALKKHRRRNHCHTDGAAVTGVSGTVLFDANADRKSTFWLWGLEAAGVEFTMLADIVVKGMPEVVSTALLSVLTWKRLGMYST